MTSLTDKEWASFPLPLFNLITSLSLPSIAVLVIPIYLGPIQNAKEPPTESAHERKLVTVTVICLGTCPKALCHWGLLNPAGASRVPDPEHSISEISLILRKLLPQSKALRESADPCLPQIGETHSEYPDQAGPGTLSGVPSQHLPAR